MSYNQPPPSGNPGQYPQYGQGQPPPPPGPPSGWSPPVPEQPAPRGRRRGITIGIVGVAAVALVVGAGVFAWAKLSGGGPQPAEAVPSNAMAYVRLDLDPSAEQKLNAMSLLQKWPQFEESTGIADDEVDLREMFVDKVLASEDCDIDYGDDIEPWIGDRLGFALVGGDAPTAMLAVQVSDEDAAESGAEKIAECTGGVGLPSSESTSAVDPVSYGVSSSADEDSNFGIAFSGEYMIIAPSQDEADKLADDAEKKSLAANNKFQGDMDAIGDPGIASAWLDAESLVDASDEMGIPKAEIESISDQVGSGATALRAGDDYLEFVSASDTKAGASGAKADVGELPESTLAAASVSDGRSMVDDFWGQLESSAGLAGPDLQYMLSDIEQTTGLSLPDDIATLFGDQFMFAVDSEGLESGAEPSSIEDVNAGIQMTSDPDELGPVIDKLSTSLDSVAGPGAADSLFSDETDDGMVVATNEDYASKLTDGGGNLGDSDAYKKAIPSGGDAVNVVYANLDEIAALVPSDDAETAEMLEPVEAFGLSTSVEKDRTFVTARLTFD